MGNFRKKEIGCLILLLALLGVFVGVNLVDSLRPPREKYHAIDFENDPWQVEFFREYSKATVQQDEWVKDAETVALRVAGYPNDDKIPPKSVDVEKVRDDMVVVTVLSRTAMDDSILRVETRVELAQERAVWRITWAGWRQQCARGIQGFNWTTSKCS